MEARMDLECFMVDRWDSCPPVRNTALRPPAHWFHNNLLAVQGNCRKQLPIRLLRSPAKEPAVSVPLVPAFPVERAQQLDLKKPRHFHGPEIGRRVVVEGG